LSGAAAVKKAVKKVANHRKRVEKRRRQGGRTDANLMRQFFLPANGGRCSLRQSLVFCS
jgi:hypothetical protein